MWVCGGILESMSAISAEDSGGAPLSYLNEVLSTIPGNAKTTLQRTDVLEDVGTGEWKLANEDRTAPRREVVVAEVMLVENFGWP